MKKINHLLLIILTGGFLFVIDQLLKYFARTNPESTYYLWKPWIGWEYFANTGIAFSLPIPNWLVVIFTPIILGGLVYWFIKSYSHISRTTYHVSYNANSATSISYLLSLILITTGAVSNYFDRVFLGFTVDYFRLFTGVINLADVMIVGGIVMLVMVSKGHQCNSGLLST